LVRAAADAGAGAGARAGNDVEMVAVWSLTRRSFSPRGSEQRLDGERLGVTPGGCGGKPDQRGDSVILLPTARHRFSG
jgi:hypothetical protein